MASVVLIWHYTHGKVRKTCGNSKMRFMVHTYLSDVIGNLVETQVVGLSCQWAVTAGYIVVIHLPNVPNVPTGVKLLAWPHSLII